MDYYCGAIPSLTDVRDFRVAHAYSAGALPKEFAISELSPMPTAKHQGTTNSCVAHAIATAIEWFSRYQGDEIADFSVGYIYGNRRNTISTEKGMSIRDAVATTCEYGDVVKSLFPYNSEVPTIIELFEEKADDLYKHGIPHRFSSYYRVSADEEIKTALKAYHPVIIGVRWYSDIRVINGVMTTDFAQSTYKGLHALLVYGWDERGWLIQNSHGANWGNGGRAILPYDYGYREAWAVTDEITENTKIMRIKELEEENQRLTESNEALHLQINRYVRDITYLNEDITRLNNKITDLKADDEADNAEIQKLIEEVHKKTEEINALTKTVGETVIQLSTSQETLEKKNLEIIDLENQIIELKKPFQSKFGRIVAKVLNFMFLVYDTIMSKRE